MAEKNGGCIKRMNSTEKHQGYEDFEVKAHDRWLKQKNKVRKRQA
jgi:hypothetical protein